MRYHADAGAQRRLRHSADVHAIEAYDARLHVIEAEEKPDDGALSGAGRAHLWRNKMKKTSAVVLKGSGEHVFYRGATLRWERSFAEKIDDAATMSSGNFRDLPTR